MSRDTSQTDRSDRRLWLSERCPSCGAQAGARCHDRAHMRRKPPATLTLHAARGWRLRPCPVCKATAGEPCFTPRGRQAARPHTARLQPARAELHGIENVWRALERIGASGARVRFSGGGGRPGKLDNVSVQASERELRSWGAGDSELTASLAAPVWGRYGTFRGQPRITATLAWSVADRSLVLAGTRGSERFEEILQPATRTPAGPARDTSRDTSPDAGDDRARTSETNTNQLPAATRECCHCSQPIPTSARPEARYCGKRCRQAASRARLREQSGRSALTPPERCTWCTGPIPTSLRPEARYCSKRCRQAASRARLALTRSPGS